jgi:A/G-specific adenine glycosylase
MRGFSTPHVVSKKNRYTVYMTLSQFQKIILAWYVNPQNKERRNLPWRKTWNPYKILVSEVMLHQTQVSRVLPKYKEFLKEFPTIEALAKTPDKKLLQVWSGLGYWRRAKYLKESAKILQKGFPKDPIELEKLPGIGPYTARAVACFAYNNPAAFLDTNIRRVYLHFFFPNTNNVSDKEILEIAQKAVYKKNAREWHYALFDYGAAVLKDRHINKRSAHYTTQSKFEGSFRSYRTIIMNHLLSKKSASRKEIFALLANSPYPKQQILDSLLKDKLIKKLKRSYSL